MKYCGSNHSNAYLFLTNKRFVVKIFSLIIYFVYQYVVTIYLFFIILFKSFPTMSKVIINKRPPNENIINELKQDLKKYSGYQFIPFKSYERQELERISKLDIEQNQKDFKDFRTKILNDKMR